MARFRNLCVALTAAVFAFGLSPAAKAAQPPIVVATAAVQPSRVAPGGKGALQIVIQVANGFHINANKPNDPDLIPTVVKGVGPSAVTFGAPVYPRPQSIKTAYEKDPMLVYQGKSVILVPFKVARSARSGSLGIKANISYQGCNAASCFPPTSLVVSSTTSIK